MNRLFKRFAIGLAAIAALWLSAAAVLIASAAPTFAGKPFVIPAASVPACVESAASRCFSTRDGKALHAQLIAGDADRPVVVLLHGIMSSAEELQPTANALHVASGAEIVSLDLRGHGASAGTFGDIDYMGQYEDDVADVVETLHKSAPSRRLILAGHSMGGGVVMRYAAKRGVPPVDGYLLFAPHLGEKSPTTRHDDAPVAAGAEAPIKLHLRRTIGLLMFNTLGITAFNDLGTLYFNVANEQGLLYYSFRAMASCAPEDYEISLRADDKPLLIVAGSRDEAFDASAYPAAAQLHAHGTSLIVAGESHDGILRNPSAIAAAASWMR